MTLSRWRRQGQPEVLTSQKFVGTECDLTRNLRACNCIPTYQLTYRFAYSASNVDRIAKEGIGSSYARDGTNGGVCVDRMEGVSHRIGAVKYAPLTDWRRADLAVVRGGGRYGAPATVRRARGLYRTERDRSRSECGTPYLTAITRSAPDRSNDVREEIKSLLRAGKELADHTRFSLATDIDACFCDPQSPWQRGSNQNTNGLLNQYFPKRTDLSVHSRRHLNKIARRLNERPRKTLGSHTPAEKFDERVTATR